METALFSYDSWDAELGDMLFYNACLKVPIGDFPAGSKFSIARIYHDLVKSKGYLTLVLDSKQYVFEIAYAVGNLIEVKRGGEL